MIPHTCMCLLWVFVYLCDGVFCVWAQTCMWMHGFMCEHVYMNVCESMHGYICMSVVCIYVWTFIFVYCMNMYICRHSMSAYMHVMMHAYLHICTCFGVCMYIYAYVCWCLCVHVCLCVCTTSVHVLLFPTHISIWNCNAPFASRQLCWALFHLSNTPLAEGLEVLVHRRWELAPGQRPPPAVTVNCARLCQDHLLPGCSIVDSAGSAVLPCPQPRASPHPIPDPPCPSSSTSHAPDLVILWKFWPCHFQL